MLELIEAELKRLRRQCGSPPPTPAEAGGRERRNAGAAARSERGFLRMLRLSGLDSDEMTDDQRDAFVNMAENLGIDAGRRRGPGRSLSGRNRRNRPCRRRPNRCIAARKLAAVAGNRARHRVRAATAIDVAAERRRVSRISPTTSAPRCCLCPREFFTWEAKRPMPRRTNDRSPRSR